MEHVHPGINSTYFGLLAEFGEANIPLAKVAPKYFGLSFAEARRRAPRKNAPVPGLQAGRPEVPVVGERDGPRRVDRRPTGPGRLTVIGTLPPADGRTGWMFDALSSRTFPGRRFA